MLKAAMLDNPEEADKIAIGADGEKRIKFEYTTTQPINLQKT